MPIPLVGAIGSGAAAVGQHLVPLLLGMLMERGVSAGARKLLATGGESATQALAQRAAQRVGSSGLGRLADAGLSRVGSRLPAAIGSRLNTGALASNAVQFGGAAAKMGLYSAPFLLADSFGSGETQKSIDGWEMFQNQPNPDVPNQMMALESIERTAAEKHLQDALREFLATREQMMGGLY